MAKKPKNKMGKKFLIGILEYGEDEFIPCLQSLYRQDHDFDFFIIRGMENKTAHQLLYGTFEHYRTQYQACVHWDADMVFNNDRALTRYAGYFNDPEIAKIMVILHDFLSDSNIPAVHIYRHDCPFYDHNDRLIPDIDAEIPGKFHYDYGDNLQPYIDHMPHPNLYQSYRYGLQRAMKIAQFDRTPVARAVQFVEYTILLGVFHAMRHKPDQRRAFCLKGAMDFFAATPQQQMQFYQQNYAGEQTKLRVEQLTQSGFGMHDNDVRLLASCPVIFAMKFAEITGAFPNHLPNHGEIKPIEGRLFNFHHGQLPAIYPQSALPQFWA